MLKQACKRTLRQIGPLIGSEDTNSMFQNHLIEGAVLHYGEFINDLSKVIVSALLRSCFVLAYSLTMFVRSVIFFQMIIASSKM